MRRILVDHARGRHRAKRGGEAARFSLDESLIEPFERRADLVALDDALTELEGAYPQQAQIVQMRFFGGLTLDDIATVLGSSKSTVEREWRHARAQLFRHLQD